MNIIDKYFGKQPNKKITSEIVEKNNYRIRESIQSFRNALKQAEQVEGTKPDRRQLYRVYNEIILDGHLKSVMDLKRKKILEYTFYIYDENQEINTTLSKIINKKYFYKIIETLVDSMFYGHSLLQIESVFNNNITAVSLIPRVNVIPETAEYMKDVNNQFSTISYLDNSELSDWLIELFYDRKDLGILSNAAPLILWKRSAMAAWSEYAEIFGMPIRIAKTESNVPEDRQRLFNFVRDLGKSAYGVIDSKESIEFIENKKADAFNVYDKLIQMIDNEISKLFLGVTMLNTNGSSRSQSEVHSEQSEIEISADLRNIEFIINDVVIPKLQKLNILPNNICFNFDRTDKLSKEAQILIDEKLNTMYPLDKDYLTTRYGVTFSDITLDLTE